MAGGGISLDLYSAKLGLILKHCISDTLTTTTITPSALAAQAYTRGTYVTSNSNVHVCTVAGTVTTLGGGLTGTTTGTTQSIDTATFMVVGATAIVMKQHVITGAPGFPTGGLSFEKRIRGSTADTYFPMSAGRIGSLNLNIPQEGILTADLTILGKAFADASVTSIAGTPTEVIDDPFTGFEAQIDVNSIAQSIVESGSISINNNFDANVFVVGLRTRKDIPPGRREIKGSFVMFFENLTQYQIFKNETVIPVRLSLIHNGNYMEIDLPECKFTGGSPTPVIAGNGTIKQTFEFTAFKDAGAYDIRITLKNQTVSF